MAVSSVVKTPQAPSAPDWPVAMTIAGSDSSGGAGIQADLATFAALGVFGTSAITALTAQNPAEVRAVEPVAPELVAAQIRAVFDDLPVAAAKTGMLARAAVIEAVAGELEARTDLHLVVDPVMVASSGARLLDADAVAVLVERLLPRCTLVTPNRPEAAVLAGGSPDAPAEALAEKILALGCRAVLVKGGHGETAECVDLLMDADGNRREFREPRQPGIYHGTGCCLSAGITAGLALGRALPEAVGHARALLAWLIGQAHQPRSRGAGVLPLERARNWPGASE